MLGRLESHRSRRPRRLGRDPATRERKARPAWSPVYRRNVGYNEAITTKPENKPVITFDAGQTLVELDLDFLARRLDERGVVVEPAALGAAAPAAWAKYDELVA